MSSRTRSLRTTSITIGLPNAPDAWEAAYANDGDPDGPAGFGSSFDKSIDLAATAATTTATRGMVSTKAAAATLATGASASKTSYVTAQYFPIGTGRKNTAAVSIIGNKVTVSVAGATADDPTLNDMLARDRIVVTYYNVKVPALDDRTSVGASIMVSDGLTSGETDEYAPYDGMAQIRVNPPPRNVVSVKPTEVEAETVTNVMVTYSITAAVYEANIITVGLPVGWSPAYRPANGSSFSKSFGPLVNPSSPSSRTSHVKVSSTLKATEYTVSSITNETSNASLVIEVDEPTASFKGKNITVTFHNVKVQGLTAGPSVTDPSEVATLTVTDTIAAYSTIAGSGRDYAMDDGESKASAIIKVIPLKRGAIAISGLPGTLLAEDILDPLQIRYTATDDLADPDPDRNADTSDDATYGRIQVTLPDGWEPMGGLIKANVQVTGSRGVQLLDVDNDPETPEHEVSGQTITVDVDSLKRGEYVNITIPKLRVADFPDITGDTHDVVVKVFSDSFDIDAGRGGELNIYTAHTLSKISPHIIDVNVSKDHPTITVNRRYLGEVTVTPAKVTAEQKENLTIRYTATRDLADPNPDRDADTDDATYGRIQITLPDGWGPATAEEIYDKRQPNDRDATYWSLRQSSAVTYSSSQLNIASTGDGYRIDIDVNAMRSRQWVELTIHNLMTARLTAERPGSFGDIAEDAAPDLVQVTVFSEMFSDEGNRGIPSSELMWPSEHSPVKTQIRPLIAAADGGSDTQPTVTVQRKGLGEVTITDDKRKVTGEKVTVTAGSAGEFTIKYTATEALSKDSVIEVRLPNWPTVPTFLKDAKIAGEPHVSLSGSKSQLDRLEDSTVSVSEESDGESIVRITLGENGLPKTNSVSLKWEGVTVQREIQEAVPIDVFSSSVNLGVPQYPVTPVTKQPKIDVIKAASGSGAVTFEFIDGVTGVMAMAGGKPNTAASVPASLTKDDHRDLVITYIPDGDMIGDKGTAQFKITLPSGWNVESHRGSRGANPAELETINNDRTITATLNDHFGETEGDSLEIVLESITTPDDHGNDRFVAESANTSDGFQRLDPIPEVLVGNTLADHDTVKVVITPPAAYEGETDVDFAITLTANGPMYDSDIQITVPDGLSDLTTDPKNRAEPNYVSKVSPSGVTVVVLRDDADDENIFITTGNLNKGGKIIVYLNNVNIEKDVVSTDPLYGFRVGTKTRGTDGPADAPTDYFTGDNLSDVAEFVPIENADGTRSIVGGLIRTVAGSGTLAVEPQTVEQGKSNVTFRLTFTASTEFKKQALKIVVPRVIQTNLVEGTHVTTSGGRYKAGADGLVVENNTITINELELRKTERLTIRVKNVNLSSDTGAYSWVTTLGGTDITDADSGANKAMAVIGTDRDDVSFAIVDDTATPITAPSYPAASKQSIRFKFTAVDTVIQPGGTLRFTIPSDPNEWTRPSVTDTANRATVGIVYTKDGEEVIEVSQKDKWALSTRGPDVILTVDPKGMMNVGDSVTVQYGTSDLTKYPVVISDSLRGTSDSDVDGLSIMAHYKVSTNFTERDAGMVWVDITNVEDGTGTAIVSPTSVRAGSTDNRIQVTYTSAGTMDNGAVRLTIPGGGWGAAQRDDNQAANYINVTATGGGVLTNFEIFDNGMTVQANLGTFGAGDRVAFVYGGSGAKGAVAQASTGEAVFTVESRGSDSGVFEAIAASPTITVGSARSGSGLASVAVTQGATAGQINAGDTQIHLTVTYTATQTIVEGELELIVPSGWTAAQQDDTNQAGYTYIEPGNAIVTGDEYGQSVTATIEMDRDDTVTIHYGWYDTEKGGAAAPTTPGTSVFQVKFDGGVVAGDLSVIVHGGTASKLMVTAPSMVSADQGTAPVAITVEIQDDTGSATVVGSGLDVTLSSSSSTGSFTDAAGDAIVDNTVTIPAGTTEATAYYSDTTVGTATIEASAAGLSSVSDTIEVTTDIDTVDENSISVSPAMAKAGDRVTVTASGTAGKTATFSVGAVVTTMMMRESPANSGSYSGSFNVVPNQQDGTHNVTVAIGDASATGANTVTIDTNAPTISGASASPSTVANGDMVTISATVTGATSVTADVSALDDTKTSCHADDG